MSQKIIKINADNDDIEKMEEDIIKAAEKSGKKSVIVNIFTYPHRALKRRWLVHYKFNKKHLVADSLIAAAILFLIGLNIFWFYGGFNYFTDKFNVKAYSSENQIKSGQEITFNIDYANNNKFELQEVIVSLKLPINFKLLKVNNDKYDRQHNTLELGDLSPGANGQIQISGTTVGALNEKLLLSANFTYYKTGSKKDRLWGGFQKTINFEYQIGGSFLKIESQLPASLISGQIFPLKIKVQNIGQFDYRLLHMKPNFDEKVLKIVSNDPLDIIDLKPGESREIELKAKVVAKEPKVSLQAEIYWEEAQTDFYGKFNFLQGIWQMEVPVIVPEFDVVEKVNTLSSVNPGDVVEIVINYDNKGKYSLENGQITLNLLSDYWDMKNVEKDSGRVEGNKIIWDASEISRLMLIQPGDKGELKVKIRTKDYVAESADNSLKSNVETKFKLEGNDVVIQNEIIENRLNSNLSLSSYPMYYTKSGDQLGRGPLPPRLGQETKYWLFVKIINDINDVDNVKVSAHLPVNVNYTGKSNVAVGDAIVYDEATRQITWSISKVPARAVNFGFAFEVAVIPSSNQVGTYPLLLDNINISGKDDVTLFDISKNINNVSTKLIQDKKGSSRDGVVR